MKKGYLGIHKNTIKRYVGRDDGVSTRSMEGIESRKTSGVNVHANQPTNKGSRFGVLEDLTKMETEMGRGEPMRMGMRRDSKRMRLRMGHARRLLWKP